MKRCLMMIALFGALVLGATSASEAAYPYGYVRPYGPRVVAPYGPRVWAGPRVYGPRPYYAPYRAYYGYRGWGPGFYGGGFYGPGFYGPRIGFGMY